MGAGRETLGGFVRSRAWGERVWIVVNGGQWFGVLLHHLIHFQQRCARPSKPAGGSRLKQDVRVRLGRGGAQASQCLRDRCIGIAFNLREDLTDKLPINKRRFNSQFSP